MTWTEVLDLILSLPAEEMDKEVAVEDKHGFYRRIVKPVENTNTCQCEDCQELSKTILRILG